MCLPLEGRLLYLYALRCLAWKSMCSEANVLTKKYLPTPSPNTRQHHPLIQVRYKAGLRMIIPLPPPHLHLLPPPTPPHSLLKLLRKQLPILVKLVGIAIINLDGDFFVLGVVREEEGRVVGGVFGGGGEVGGEGFLAPGAGGGVAVRG